MLALHQVLLTNAFKRDVELQLMHDLGKGAQVNTEIFQYECGGTFKAGAVVAPGVFTVTDQCYRHLNLLGFAFQRQVTGQHAFIVTTRLKAGGNESGSGVLVSSEEVIAQNMAITLGMVTVETVYLHFHFYARSFKVLRIVVETAFKGFEITQQL